MSRWIWGVDCGRHFMAIVALDYDDDRRVADIVEYRDLSPSSVAQVVDRFAYTWEFDPLTIAVELPRGRFPEPELMLNVGAVHVGLFKATGRDPWSIDIGEWKRRSIGRGNASKAQVRAWAQTWCDGAEAPPEWTQDECDALGIAWAARQIWREASEKRRAA